MPLIINHLYLPLMPGVGRISVKVRKTLKEMEVFLLQNQTQNVPEIIRAAAQSPLGVASLIILALSVLGYVFFRNEGPKVKAGAFVLMLCGFMGFGIAMTRTGSSDGNGKPSPTPASTPTPVATDDETKCIEEQTKEIEKNPDYAEAIYERGGCYQRRNKGDDMTKAINDYSKVIELDRSTNSERADVYQNRANAYEARGERGDMDRAIEDYTTAINFTASGKSGSANKYDLLKDRGYAYVKLGRRDLMLDDFKTICREASNSEQCRIVKKDIR